MRVSQGGGGGWDSTCKQLANPNRGRLEACVLFVEHSWLGYQIEISTNTAQTRCL